MKTTFVAVTAAAIRRRQYVESQVVGHVDAVAAWEWRMLNSLAILAWPKTSLRNALAAGPRAPVAEYSDDEEAVDEDDDEDEDEDDDDDVQLLLMTIVAFFDLVHVAFLAPLRVRQKSPPGPALVVSAASDWSLRHTSKKTGQPSLLIGHYVQKTGLIAKTGDRFFQRSDQSEGLVDRFSCL